MADLVEAVGNITSDDLHPDVAAALQDVDLAVTNLIDKARCIITDRIEAVGNRLVALADFHLGGLLPHDFVKHLGLTERARDQRDPILVEVRNLLQKRVDRGGLHLHRHQSYLAQTAGSPVEVLHRGRRGNVCHGVLDVLDSPGPTPVRSYCELA